MLRFPVVTHPTPVAKAHPNRFRRTRHCVDALGGRRQRPGVTNRRFAARSASRYGWFVSRRQPRPLVGRNLLWPERSLSKRSKQRHHVVMANAVTEDGAALRQVLASGVVREAAAGLLHE